MLISHPVWKRAVLSQKALTHGGDARLRVAGTTGALLGLQEGSGVPKALGFMSKGGQHAAASVSFLLISYFSQSVTFHWAGGVTAPSVRLE